MEEVISSQRTLDNVILEGEYEYPAYITIDGDKTGNYHVKLEFNNLNSENFKDIANLYKDSKPLRIESEIIKKWNFNITHIIIEKFWAGSKFAMIWECFSKDPLSLAF
ncbi:MAG: hypothetical protein ABJA71_01715 [Ginsengibacter sp.]